MNKQSTKLIDDFYIPQRLKGSNLNIKYLYFRKFYRQGNHWIFQNNVRVFGPFPKPNEPWDISEYQKIAIYNYEVQKVLKWINTKIVLNLAIMDYKTVAVLLRIATGMLNKCDIPKDVQIYFHDNMVKNIENEHIRITLCELPF